MTNCTEHSKLEKMSTSIDGLKYIYEYTVPSVIVNDSLSYECRFVIAGNDYNVTAMPLMVYGELVKSCFGF